MIQYLWMVAPFAPLLPLLAAVKWEIYRRARDKERSPVDGDKMLRPPGYWLSLKLERLQECLSLQVAASALCMGLLSIIGRQSVVAAVVTGALGFIATLFAWNTAVRMRNTSAGLRGEQVIAEKLNALLAQGWFVFHDLQTRACGNIDHIVVGPGGVFAIETKYRRKKRSRNEQREHEVIVNEDSLRWPAYTDHQSISQAQRNAGWLARFLNRKATEPIPVEAVIAIPGWLVTRRTPSHTVSVLSGNELAGFLGRQPVQLTSAQVDVIRAKLDERCRDVEI